MSLKSLAIVVSLTTASLALGGCATIQSLVGNTATSDAMKASEVALTTYADVYQPALMWYGKLPDCPNPTPSGTICRDPHLFALLKVSDAAAVKSIVAAQGVIEGTATDTGQIEAALSAVAAAELQISQSGIMKQAPAPATSK